MVSDNTIKRTMQPLLGCSTKFRVVIISVLAAVLILSHRAHRDLNSLLLEKPEPATEHQIKELQDDRGRLKVELDEQKLLSQQTLATLLSTEKQVDDLKKEIQVQSESKVAEVESFQQCIMKLPEWVKTNSAFDVFGAGMVKGSKGLSDKTAINHRYQYMYQRYMSGFAQRVCEEGRSNRIRILEIGLGCSRTGGMVNGKPGGSALGWRYLFPAPAFDLDLHIMEFDGECGKKWEAENPGIAIVHHGDSSKPESLKKVIKEAGGDKFDFIIDDGSHLNAHQITALDTLITDIAEGGSYIVEDIHSACSQWTANTGKVETGLVVSGTKGCMETKSGEPTILAHILDWQKKLAVQREPSPGVKNIDVNLEAVVIHKPLNAPAHVDN